MRNQNNNLIQAWIRLEEALKNTNDSDDENSPNKEFQSVLGPTKKNNQQHAPQRPQSSYKLSQKTYENYNPISQLSESQQIQPQQMHNSKVNSLKSLMNLRAKARPHSRPATANIHVQQTDLQRLSQIPIPEMDDLIKQTEIINSLKVDQILDLFTAKCIDSKVDYKPQQAVIFIEKIKKQCVNSQFILKDSQLGLECANVLAHIFQENQFFTRLVLEKNSLGNSGAILIGESLKYNETLIFLNLASNDITQDGFASLFESLIENKILISLDISNKEGLSRNKLGDKGAEYLGNYLRYTQVLQFLNLSNLHLSISNLEAVLEGIQNCPNLVSLDLSNNDLGLDAAEKIINSIIDSELEDIGLAGNKLADYSIQFLTKALNADQKHYKIKKINLANNGFTSYGISKVFESLNKNSTIQTLILDDNNFGGKNFDAITHLLWENLTLRIISLNRCQIDHYGADYLGMGLARNRVVQELYLNFNKVKNQGVKTIAEGIKDHNCLKVLELERCSIDDEGGLYLSEMLRRNRVLESLNLKENNLHDYTGAMISDSVRENKNILKIQLERNPISYKFTEQIQKNLVENARNKKRNQLPMYMQKMEELRLQENQQFNVQEQKQELYYKAQEAQDSLMQQQERIQMLERKEIEITKELSQTLHKIKETYQACESDYDKMLREQENHLFNQNQAISKYTRDKSAHNLEINQMKQEISKQKEKMKGERLLESVKLEEKERVQKEWQNKCKTSTIGYESLIKQMNRIRAFLEKGSDDESEKKVEVVAPVVQVQKQEQKNKNNKKQTKKGDKSPPPAKKGVISPPPVKKK